MMGLLSTKQFQETTRVWMSEKYAEFAMEKAEETQDLSDFIAAIEAQITAVLLKQEYHRRPS